MTRLRESLIDQPPWLRPRSTATVQALVGAGLGAAVVPRLAVHPDETNGDGRASIAAADATDRAGEAPRAGVHTSHSGIYRDHRGKLLPADGRCFLKATPLPADSQARSARWTNPNDWGASPSLTSADRRRLRRSMSATAAPDVTGQIRRARQPRVERQRSATAAPADQSGSERRAQWQSIEVRHLAGNCRGGAGRTLPPRRRAAGVVESANQRQIAHWEQAVGARILERASGTPMVSLTAAGSPAPPPPHRGDTRALRETAYAESVRSPHRTAASCEWRGWRISHPAEWPAC